MDSPAVICRRTTCDLAAGGIGGSAAAPRVSVSAVWKLVSRREFSEPSYAQNSGIPKYVEVAFAEKLPRVGDVARDVVRQVLLLRQHLRLQLRALRLELPFRGNGETTSESSVGESALRAFGSERMEARLFETFV